MSTLDLDRTNQLARPSLRRRRNPDMPAWQEPAPRSVQALKAVVLIFLAVVMVFPFLYVISVSFSSTRDVLAA